jgi:deazaflavin-dependent oxidoreductase (nitroreductase family)
MPGLYLVANANSRSTTGRVITYNRPMALPQSIDDRTRDALSREQTVIDITTTGWKSGKPRRLEIVLHNIDGRLYISGQPRRERRQWLDNLARDPHLTVHLKRGIRADLPATAREITDPAERRTVLRGVARHWKRDDVDTMVQYSPLIEVSLG